MNYFSSLALIMFVMRRPRR